MESLSMSSTPDLAPSSILTGKVAFTYTHTPCSTSILSSCPARCCCGDVSKHLLEDAKFNKDAHVWAHWFLIVSTGNTRGGGGRCSKVVDSLGTAVPAPGERSPGRTQPVDEQSQCFWAAAGEAALLEEGHSRERPHKGSGRLLGRGATEATLVNTGHSAATVHCLQCLALTTLPLRRL